MPVPSPRSFNVKVLIQKMATMAVVQGIIYGIFLLVDPGFIDSLVGYFILVVVISLSAVAVVHLRNEIRDARPAARSVLDEPDFTGR